MKIRISTSMLPIVCLDTYGTEFQYNILEECWEDFKDLMLDKAKEAIDYALEETDFKGAKLTNLEFHSPKFYNYTTDSMLFDMEFDDSLINTIRWNVNDDFFEYIKKYGSRSGFCSFYPTEKDKFYEALTKEDDIDYAICLYIMWQVEKEIDIDNYQQKYFDEVWDEACQNGYEEDVESST